MLNPTVCLNEHQFFELQSSSSTNFPIRNERIPRRSTVNPTLCWNEHQFFKHQSRSSKNFPSKHERASSCSMLDPTLSQIRISTLWSNEVAKLHEHIQIIFSSYFTRILIASRLPVFQWRSETTLGVYFYANTPCPKQNLTWKNDPWVWYTPFVIFKIGSYFS